MNSMCLDIGFLLQNLMPQYLHQKLMNLCLHRNPTNLCLLQKLMKRCLLQQLTNQCLYQKLMNIYVPASEPGKPVPASKADEYIMCLHENLCLHQNLKTDTQANQTGRKAEAKKATDNKGEAEAKANPTQTHKMSFANAAARGAAPHGRRGVRGPETAPVFCQYPVILEDQMILTEPARLAGLEFRLAGLSEKLVTGW
nr:hypothetical protein BaRGS_011487 [Batillaria attramentaria]